MTTTTAANSAFDSTLANLGIKRTSTSVNPETAKLGRSSLDQSDFLRLMTAQMKNQDPFSPVDNTQMVAQMAQFSSVAGISEMNQSLAGIAAKLGSTSTADAMGYVGRTVLTKGNTAYERTSGGIAGAVELAGDATDVNVSIADKDGNIVRNIQLGESKAGEASYSWDGTDGAGNRIANGPYKISVEAAKGSLIVPAESLVWAPVESATLPANGEPVLNVVGLGEVAPSAVRKVA